jgi:GDP-4-dehydro-6-deoxy-D-mannose reductase
MDRAAGREWPSRILITGYGGFVSRYLVPACRRRYPAAQLFGLCRSPADAVPPRMFDSHPQPVEGVEHLVAEITAPEQVRAAVARAWPDLIFHLAAQASVAASWEDPAATLQINAGGTIHLLEAVRAEQLTPRIVLVGSGEQYGLVPPERNPITEDCVPQPANPYAVSKVAQDLYGYQYHRAYGMAIVRARPFNHFGPGQSPAFVIPNFARQIALIEAGRAEPRLLVGNLQARRDFLPVEDVIEAYLAIAERGQPGAAYNVASGQARAIAEVLELLLAQARLSVDVVPDPSRLRPVDAPLLVADTVRLREQTGWQPSVDFADALRRTLDYWRAEVARAVG